MKLSRKPLRKIFERALWWCALFAVSFLSAAYAFPLLSGYGGNTYPKESGSSSEKQKTVLSLWHTDTFEGGKGSRAAFLKNVATEYGKRHKNVIVMVSGYSAEGLQAALKEGKRPDLLSFGIGANVDVSLFLPLNAELARNVKSGRTAGTKQTAYSVPWCMNCYVTYAKEGDFSNVSNKNCIVSAGGNNLAEVAAAFALNREENCNLQVVENTSAYLALLGGEVNYLLGTGRDLYRFSARKASVRATLALKYNDLYQQIGVLCDREDKNKSLACAEFIEFLLSESVQKRLPDIGMFSACFPVYAAAQNAERANEETLMLAAELEKQLFETGGARYYMDAFASAETRSVAREQAKNYFSGGKAEGIEKYLKEK